MVELSGVKQLLEYGLEFMQQQDRYRIFSDQLATIREMVERSVELNKLLSTCERFKDLYRRTIQYYTPPKYPPNYYPF